MENNYIKFGLSFQLPQKVSDRAIAISKELGSKYKTRFILDGENFYPHMTIYPPSYPAKNLSKILSTVEKASNNFDPVGMKFFKIESKNGYVMIYFDLSPEIKNLHKSIVEVLNPLREEYINPKYNDLEYLKRLTAEEMENVKKYGYPYVIDCYYHPHLSLIRLEDIQEAKKIIDDVQWDIKTFEVNKLVLHKIGPNGAAVEVIKEFDLKA